MDFGLFVAAGEATEFLQRRHGRNMKRWGGIGEIVTAEADEG